MSLLREGNGKDNCRCFDFARQENKLCIEFEVSHAKRKNKDALRVGHPAFAVRREKGKGKNNRGSFDSLRFGR